MIFWALIISCGSFQQARAQTCCSGGVPLSGNLGMPAGDQNTWQLSLSYDLNRLRTLKVGTEKLDDRSRLRTTHSAMLEVGYTFSKRFATDLFMAFVGQERKILNPGLPDQIERTNGLGDAVILFKYFIINQGGDVLALGAGPKIPLGASDIKDQGILLGADLQPGSGAWDGVLWTYYNHQLEKRKSMSYTFTASYRYTGTNNNFRADQSYRFGSEFQGILGIGDRVVIGKILIDPALTFRYRRAFEDEVASSELPNTGGEWVFVYPSFGVSLTSNMSFQIGIELPVYAHVTGTQLTPTYRLNTGLYVILNSSSTDFMNIKPQ